MFEGSLYADGLAVGYGRGWEIVEGIDYCEWYAAICWREGCGFGGVYS